MMDDFYIPKLNFRENVLYINDFKKIFLKEFSINFGKLIHINLPISSNIDNNLNFEFKNLRMIDFDNAFNFQIYEIIYNYDSLIRYIYYNFNPNEDEIIVCEFNNINRDKNISTKQDIESNIINFEIKVVEEKRDKKFLQEFLDNVWKIICKVANCLEQTQININHKIDFIDADKIAKLYPTISISNAIKNFLLKKKIVAIRTNLEMFEEFFQNKSIINCDVENTYSIFVWSDYLKGIIELISLTIRPNWSIIKNQFHITDENEKKFNNEYFDILKSDKTGISLSVKINWDNLFYYLLNKNNFNELPSKTKNFNLKKII